MIFLTRAETAYGDRTGWLGRQDSNLGMAESKSAALPLGYAPNVQLPSTGEPRRAQHSRVALVDQRALRNPGGLHRI
jgi:hypothetical protein